MHNINICHNKDVLQVAYNLNHMDQNKATMPIDSLNHEYQKRSIHPYKLYAH